MANKFQIKDLPEDVYSRLFEIYEGQPEKPWVLKWWNRLSRKGLTGYSNAKEYNAVLGRLVTIAYLYHRWTEDAYVEVSGIEKKMAGWFDLLPWIQDKDISGFPDEWYCEESEGSCHNSVSVHSIIEQEFETVTNNMITQDPIEGGIYGLGWEMRLAAGRPPVEAGFQSDDVSPNALDEEYARKFWEETGMTPDEHGAVINFEQFDY